MNNDIIIASSAGFCPGVKNAIETIDEADLVMIHDGARPLVREEDIENTIIEANNFGAAAVGVPVKDTIKVIDDNSFVCFGGIYSNGFTSFSNISSVEFLTISCKTDSILS